MLKPLVNPNGASGADDSPERRDIEANRARTLSFRLLQAVPPMDR